MIGLSGCCPILRILTPPPKKEKQSKEIQRIRFYTRTFQQVCFWHSLVPKTMKSPSRSRLSGYALASLLLSSKTSHRPFSCTAPFPGAGARNACSPDRTLPVFAPGGGRASSPRRWHPRRRRQHPSRSAGLVRIKSRRRSRSDVWGWFGVGWKGQTTHPRCSCGSWDHTVIPWRREVTGVVVTRPPRSDVFRVLG